MFKKNKVKKLGDGGQLTGGAIVLDLNNRNETTIDFLCGGGGKG